MVQLVFQAQHKIAVFAVGEQISRAAFRADNDAVLDRIFPALVADVGPAVEALPIKQTDKALLGLGANGRSESPKRADDDSCDFTARKNGPSVKKIPATI